MTKFLEPYAPCVSDRKIPAGYEPPPEPVDYPDSDGKPMGDSDLQREWIVFLIQSLRLFFINRTDVYVTGDLFWYPVEGNNKIVTAPDTMVVFGRPHAMRHTYRQWHEEGIAPQVVFEVLSHCNTPSEMTRKRHFYDKYGVEEYYVYDPADPCLEIWTRGEDGHLVERVPEGMWNSPRLGILFDQKPGEDLVLRHPDGRSFQGIEDLYIEMEKERAEKERERAEKERLAAKLRELGVDPEL